MIFIHTYLFIIINIITIIIIIIIIIIIRFIYINYDYEDSSLNLFQELIRVFNRIITSYKQSNIISNLISQQLQRQNIDLQSSIISVSELSKTCKPNIKW